jgi:hypothetical protein
MEHARIKQEMCTVFWWEILKGTDDLVMDGTEMPSTWHAVIYEIRLE